MTTPKYILFDVDGTLVQMHKGFMPGLIARLLHEIGREDAVIDGTSYAGRTDRDIFTQLLEDNDMDVGQYDTFRQLYVRLLDEMLHSGVIDRLAGSVEAIEHCLSRGHHVGLLTGNFREAAFIKLNRTGLDSYFEYGAFGGDEANRNKLPAQAFSKAKSFIPDLKPENMVIIGDTPRDIACARHFGCISVGVATGPYSREQLAEHSPDMVLDDMSRPESWVAALGA